MLLVRRARVPASLLPLSLQPAVLDSLEPSALCDLALVDDRIIAVAPTGETPPIGPGVVEFDAGGMLVFPGFIDAHTHLDKTHTWYRAPNRSGTFAEAITALAHDKDHWTEADLLRRAGFALRTAWAQGTRVIRTHLDTGPQSEVSHATLAKLREQWRGRITIQTVPLCATDAFTTPEADQIADLALRYGASALGGFLIMSPDLPRQLDHTLAIACERGVGIDLHVDENDNPQAECLRLVAEAVLRNQFPYPVVCGHCCSLAVQDSDRARSTIDLVRAARIGIISLPLCNAYLQDRRTPASPFPRTPRWRGVTLIHDLLAAGVPVACAGDNVRDAFYAYGNYDMFEVYLESVRLAHLDSTLADSVRVVTSTAADLVGLPTNGRIAPGSPAQLVVFDAHSFSELLSRPATPRRCIDGELVHTPRVPDFSELGDRPV